MNGSKKQHSQEFSEKLKKRKNCGREKFKATEKEQNT